MHGTNNWFPVVEVEPNSDADDLTKHVFRVGEFDIPLLLKVVIDYDNIEYDEHAGIDRTGCHLWPSSTAVVSVMLGYGIDRLRDARVLELGCGTGFCGLVARQFAKRVVLSDRHEGALQLAGRNSRLQSHPVELAAYGWEPGCLWPAEKGEFNLVLASDVLYEEDGRVRYEIDMLERFFALINWGLAPHGTAILGHVERNTLGHEDVLAAAQQVFDVERLDARECVDKSLISRAGSIGLRSTVVFCCTRRGESPLKRS
eukprot:TRINITY_DN114497_c0_g1_i1.p1 TRINITY_DN114497_c0_g1~~TRINITY_DN114497_c0_g1_i1.p1  ORF type:complete len:258 (+),score=38.28 TRINITY_DN114497_c0_g1_i1:57-830(+)